MFRFIVFLFIFFMSAQSLYSSGHDLEEGRIEYEKKQSGIEHGFKAITYKWYILGVTNFVIDVGLVCPPSDLTSGQAFSIVGDYIKNPAKRYQSAAVLIFDSLALAYPCPTSDSQLLREL